MINDVNFVELLAKMQKNEASCEEEEDFYQKYIDSPPETAEDFNKLLFAAEHEFIGAYKSLGRAYLYGSGCEANPILGIAFIKKSVKHDKSGAILLGHFYRNGMFVEKDFAEAYEWYVKAIQMDDVGDTPDPRELIMQIKEAIDLSTLEADLSWWEFVINRTSIQEAILPNILDQLRYLYDQNHNCERYCYWTEKAAEAGSLWAKFDHGKRLLNEHNESSLTQAISLLNEVARSGYSDVNADLAIELILSSETTEEVKHDLLVWVLNNADSDIVRNYFKKQGKESSFDEWAEKWHEDGDEEQEELPDDSFRCPCCHKVHLLDDQSNPDLQGEYCDECYNTGSIYE